MDGSQPTRLDFRLALAEQKRLGWELVGGGAAEA